MRAALECFNAHGVEACSIAAICERSQASVGSIYHHFGSKEGLAGALYCEGLRRFQRGYLEALEGAADARQGIGALVRYHLSWVVDNPDWARYLLRTRTDALQPQARQAPATPNEGFYAAMGARFSAQVQAGAIRRLPRSVYVALLVGPCQEWARMVLRDGSNPHMDEVADALADAAWRALGASTEPAAAAPRTGRSRP